MHGRCFKGESEHNYVDKACLWNEVVEFMKVQVSKMGHKTLILLEIRLLKDPGHI